MNAAIQPAAARSWRSLFVALALLPWIAGCGADVADVADDAPHSTTNVHPHGEHAADDHATHDAHDDHGNHDHDAHAGGHSGDTHETNGAAAAVPAEQPADAHRRPVTLESKIKIKSGDGARVYSIKWKEDGAKLVDADEQEIARYNVSDGGGKLKVKDPDDNVVGYLVGDRASGRIKVEDSTQERELYKLIRQEDGDWKLEDAADHLLVRVKLRDYGAELESPSDQSLYKVKARDGKTSLRNAKDETTLYTNSPVQPMSFACLGLDVIKDLRIRAALLVHMQAVHSSHR